MYLGTKMCLDTSIFATSFIDSREYHIPGAYVVFFDDLQLGNASDLFFSPIGYIKIATLY
jgi:hypothetical protein